MHVLYSTLLRYFRKALPIFVCLLPFEEQAHLFEHYGKCIISHLFEEVLALVTD